MGDRPFFAETPSQLKHLALQITQVADHDWPITVRDLLSWFGASRRSRRNVKRIREALDEVGLITDPDFEGENIDATVILLPKGTLYESAAEAADGLSIGDAAQAELVQKSVVLSPIQLADPAQRISRLASARKRPVSVTPDAPIGEAITLMLCHDYSQLPVMQSDHDVKGLFTWKSYGKRLAHGRKPTCVREAMDDYQGIAYDASLFEAITLITSGIRQK
jgi:CBS domain-containing protein